MIHFLQGALVFIVGVAIAGGLAIAVGGPAAPCLAARVVPA